MDAATNYHLRVMRPEELKALYKNHIELDFPSAERPNLRAMHRHVAQGLQDFWLIADGEMDAGYAICARFGRAILVTLLSIYPERRGKGLGTRLLSLLKQQYADTGAILLEVEDPAGADTAEDRRIRERRIAFYMRSGYCFLPEIEHVSFGVPLLIMALPLADNLAKIRASVGDDLTNIYHRILPESLWNRVLTRTRP